MAAEDIREIFRLLRKIEADVAAIKTENRFDHEKLVEVEKRVDKLESDRDMSLGAKAAMFLVASSIGYLVSCLVQWFSAKGGS